MAPALTSFDFRNAALVYIKLSRNPMLVMPFEKALPDFTDRFVIQVIGHDTFSIHGDLKG